MSVVSDTVGLQRTLTVATLATLADVDFRDIVAAGASIALGNWAGTRIGNCLGNSNITFDAPKTVYWSRLAGDIWNSSAWALTSGGGGAVNNFPLAQDTAIIDDAGLNASATITISTNADIGTLSMATRTTALTLALGNTDPRFYGNVTLCSSLTTTGVSSPTYQFVGQGLANTLNTAGVTLALSQFNVNCPNGSLTLANNTTIELTATSSGTAILSAGTFNLNGFNLTAVAFSNSNATTRTLTQGSGTINITGSNGAIWGSSNATGLTYTTRPVVNFTYAGSTGSRTITTNAASIIDANVTAGTDTVTVSSAFNNLNFTGFKGILSNSTRTIFGNLTLSPGIGMTLTAGALVTTFDRTGTKILTSAGKTMDFPVIFSGGGITNCVNPLTLGPTRALTITDGTLNLGESLASQVGSFVTTGTAPKSLGSTIVGTQAFLYASANSTVTYLTIRDSLVGGGVIWDALAITNVDAGNNTGWLFSTTPSISNEITMRLRSFTQPRRF
jgi:hypothetical protein